VAHEEEDSASRRATRSMTTDAARRAVFDTTELLESILVCLPPKILFGVLRVSRRFRAIIAASVPIQEKMYLRLRDKSQHAWLLEGGWEDPHFVGGITQSPGHPFFTPASFNPFLRLRHQDLSCAERAQEDVSKSARLILQKPITLAVLRSNTSSILDTYMFDPPSHEVEVSFLYRIPGGHVSGSAHFEDKEICNWTLRDMIRATLEDHGWSYIYLEDHGCGSHGNPRSFQGETDEHGDLKYLGRVIQHYEKVLGTKTDGTHGISMVDFQAHGIVVPTEAERAAVKAVKAAA
jgi:hypothetical protein